MRSRAVSFAARRRRLHKRRTHQWNAPGRATHGPGGARGRRADGSRGRGAQSLHRETFEAELRLVISADASTVVLDLGAVAFIDSTGLRSVLRIGEPVASGRRPASDAACIARRPRSARGGRLGDVCCRPSTEASALARYCAEDGARRPQRADRTPIARHAACTFMARVVVVGAGFAGLAAADELRAGRIEVTVLEARDRVGGRVLVGAVRGERGRAGRRVHPSGNTAVESWRRASTGPWSARARHTAAGRRGC